MADIGHLGGLAPVKPLDLENYADNKGFQTPEAGVYELQVRDSFPSEAYGKSKADALQVTLDPTIVGPTNAGFKLRFAKVSAKQFERAGKTVSQLGDFLRAVGVSGTYNDPQEQANAAEQTANRTFKAYLDWEVNKDGFEVKGMRNFPKNENGNGGYRPWVEHPTLKGTDGEPLRLRANIVITRFIPAGEER